MLQKLYRFIAASVTVAILAVVLISNSHAADAVFSGPQPGEATTPFKTLALNAQQEFSEADPIKEHNGAPTTLVFVHTVERSIVPLLKVIDQYASERGDKMKGEVIFLAADRLQGEQRTKAVNSSLKLKSRVSLSPDGAEGPGNYGLNKECMVTVIVAKGNKVAASFALVQPGITDAPKIIAAMAAASNDSTPPKVEELSARAMHAGDRRMAPAAADTRMPALVAERLPGAVPTDPELNTLLRQAVRKENEDAAVDKIIEQMNARIKGDAALTKQAVEGWKRVLHLGDRYGTEYARKLGKEFVAKHEKASTGQ